jgi:hypothetical protein
MIRRGRGHVEVLAFNGVVAPSCWLERQRRRADRPERPKAGDGARHAPKEIPKPRVKAKRVQTTGQSGMVLVSYEATVAGQVVTAIREEHLRERVAEIDPDVELEFG